MLKIVKRNNDSISAHKMCDGHVYGTWTGVVVWATVHYYYVDADTRTIHRSCLRHRSIYSTFGGKAGC